MNFDEKLERLDEALRVLEDGSTPLDDAMIAFERGVSLLREAREYINGAEQKVEFLTREAEEEQYEEYEEGEEKED
jgi:exodeoxyribonuclease VII small subunit